MDRHATRIEDDILYVETGDGWLEVGTMTDVYDRVGGREYTIQYDEDAAAVGWLDTDADDTITFDVRDVIAEMTYEPETVDHLQRTPMDPGADGVPERTAAFADLMTRIWDSKGALDDRPERP